MVKLRHIVGNNLKELEAVLEKSKTPLVVISVNWTGSNWYIHYLLQTWEKEEKPAKVEIVKKTKTIRRK